MEKLIVIQSTTANPVAGARLHHRKPSGWNNAYISPPCVVGIQAVPTGLKPVVKWVKNQS